MAKSKRGLGQLITFQTQLDSSQKYANYIWIRALKGDTVRKIAARRGHPEMVHEIGVLNHIRSATTVLKTNQLIKLPGTLAKGTQVNVLADDPPPLMKDGYAMYDVVARPGGKGLSRFLGYNPISYDVPIQWEEWAYDTDGSAVEQQIKALEGMAGRGQGTNAATGPPAVIGVSVTDNNGLVVLLLPYNYQRSPANPTAPLWRISNIAWDASPLRLENGNRVRQKAVVTIAEYTPVTTVVRSASTRSRQRNTIVAVSNPWQNARAAERAAGF